MYVLLFHAPLVEERCSKVVCVAGILNIITHGSLEVDGWIDSYK